MVEIATMDSRVYLARGISVHGKVASEEEDECPPCMEQCVRIFGRKCDDEGHQGLDDVTKKRSGSVNDGR